NDPTNTRGKGAQYIPTRHKRKQDVHSVPKNKDIFLSSRHQSPFRAFTLPRKKIVQALADGARNISTLSTTLSPLSRFHAYQLRIHPTDFKLFNHCILVTLACYMGDNFTPVAHAAVDKFLSAFSAVLAEKFR
ncbi:hemoglobin subunit alpha-D-like, partial [Myxocyprinus asiaticus]|uniref:hemoglobin subunit alpha-D-like n=1 Tax=Myxocyprinus asiaticus TaxID=70543 RepID=UPI002221C321